MSSQARSAFPSLQALLLAGLVLLTFFGCTGHGCSKSKDTPPEQQLHSYLTLAVNVTKSEQRADLLDLTTGQIHSSISAASEEAFKKAYIDRKYEFKSFEVLRREDTVPDKETEIEFKISYKTWMPGEVPERQPVIETKKLAKLKYELGRWVIASVDTLDSSFDWDTGLPLSGVDTKGVSPEDPPVEIDSSMDDKDDDGMDATPDVPGATTDGAPKTEGTPCCGATKADGASKTDGAPDKADDKGDTTPDTDKH